MTHRAATIKRAPAARRPYLLSLGHGADLEHARGVSGQRPFIAQPPLYNSPVRCYTAGFMMDAASAHNRRFVGLAEIEPVELEWCHVEWLSNPNIVAAKHLLLCRATFPPNEAHNFHFHPVHEEILYILEGEAEQWVGEEKRLLRPGEIAHIPPGVPHCTFNNGSDTLRFLAMLGPTGEEGPMVVDCFNQEPWKSLRPPIFYKSQQGG